MIANRRLANSSTIATTVNQLPIANHEFAHPTEGRVHVDFEDRLAAFYGRAGFKPAAAGLIRLRPSIMDH